MKAPRRVRRTNSITLHWSLALACLLLWGCNSPKDSSPTPPPKPQEEAAPKEPAPAPIEALDAAGLIEVLEASQAPLTIVSLWATWCPACLNDLPILTRIQRAKPEAVRVILVSVNIEEERPAVLQLLRGAGVDFSSYQLAGDEDAFIEAFLPTWDAGLPMTVFFNRQGERVFQLQGELDELQVLAEIDRILGELKASGSSHPMQ